MFNISLLSGTGAKRHRWEHPPFNIEHGFGDW